MGALRFREIFYNRWISFIQFTFSSIVRIWSQESLMTTLSILVLVCIWVLGFYKLEALGALMGFIEFFFLHGIVVILTMLLSLFVWYSRWVACYGWKIGQWISHWRVKVNSMCNKGLWYSWFIFVYVLEAFITLN